ncbi:Aly/REF export factor 2 [Colletotrichum sidae]|uniref:Aly/REF export factor 2 n=1 Tax=Colletotrichum sidae TaxID=1347389 RepID=A0A4R8TV30_9PEZI|nr:Aly/REF export factor 2 [Colletotrichum sidae]
MADRMDRSLDEILAEKKNNGPRNRHGGGGGGGGAPRRRERERQEYPRDGSFRDEPRNLDSEWVHDRFEEHDSRRGPSRRRRDSPEERDTTSAKLRVENIHYELTAEDLEELFTRIGPVAKLDLKYDRAGRSEGIAFITMQSHEDAQEAIKEFDGANANGQPIRLTLLTGGRNPRSRNPFDSAVMPGRPLSERISAPGGRSRSLSPGRRYDVDEAASRGIDRYVPGNRSRSPMPRRRGGGGGRRPGARREGGRDGGREGGRDQDGGRGGRGAGRDSRARKTQEELDAEMADYFGGGNSEQAAPQANGGSEATQAAAAPTDDIDMIE